jgi:hypothetical protein
MVQAMFEQLAAGRSEDALRSVSRLQDLSPGQPLLALARMHEEKRLVLTRASASLAQGELRETQRLLAAQKARLGASPAFAVAEALVDSLQAVAAYEQQLPFADSFAAGTALARVVAAQPALAGSGTFHVWLQRQTTMVEALRQVERERCLRQLAQAYDLAVVSGAANRELVLAQLLALEPRHPVARFRELLGSAGPSELTGFLAAQLPGQGAEAVTLEAALCCHWDSVPAATREAARDRLAAEAASLAGLLLRARIAAEGGARGTAVTLAERLCRQVPLRRDVLSDLVTQAVLAPGQFTARPWRATFPTMTDWLNRLTQVREQGR